MSRFDGQRLNNHTFQLDVERLRRAWYTDKCFGNIADTLAQLARQDYRLPSAPEVAPGNVHVEMQVFARRQPHALVCGVDKALTMLHACTGYTNGDEFVDTDRFVDTHRHLEVWAVHDGDRVHYEGDPMRVQPVMRIRGRYRDFAVLETALLGVLARGTRVASNVYDVLKAARGKPVFFLPARFDAYEVQADDGYAYHIAVQRYNADYQADCPQSALQPAISTDAQGQWWGGAGGGTIPHAAISCFLGDTTAAMLAFAETCDARVPRIVPVDFHNDNIGESLKVMAAMFARYREHIEAGQPEKAIKFVLYAVRPDTSSELRDVRVEPLGDPALDCGVNPRLVSDLRRALDSAYLHWDLPPEWLERARQWCQSVKIVVTGGLDRAKIERFERLQTPIDIYGVGSHLLSSCSACGTNSDYSADVVRVRLNGRWVDMAPVGRQACDNPDLKRVDWQDFDEPKDDKYDFSS